MWPLPEVAAASPSLALALEGLSPQLLEAMKGQGVCALGFLARTPSDERGVEQLLRELCPDADEEKLATWVVPLQSVLLAAQGAAVRRRDNYGQRGAFEHAEFVGWHLVSKRQRLSEREPVIPTPPPPAGHPASCRWPTRFAKALAEAADPQGREHAEKAERDRWVGELCQLLTEAETASYKQSLDAMNPEAALRGAAAGYRVRTLRVRLRRWQALRKWLLANYDVVYPRGVQDLLDFLQVRADEPCGPTVLTALSASFAWFEARAGTLPHSRLTALPYYRDQLAELDANLVRDPNRPAKQAPRLLVSVVCALERHVINSE